MASLYTALDSLRALIEAATSGLGISPAPEAALGWPPVNRLQQIGQGLAGPVLTVWDRKMGRNTTRWAPEVVAQTLTPATLTAAISLRYITRSESSAITLGGAAGTGDAVAAVFTRHNADGSQAAGAAVTSAGAGATLTSMAAALAAAINADPLLASWVLATPAGPVVNLAPEFVNGSLQIAANTGNGGTQTREVGRRERQVQIVAWAATQAQRRLLVDAISGVLALADAGFGVTLGDGTAVRVSFANDYDLDDNTLQDVYRHDFLVAAEYPITVQDQLYAVLAPVLAFALDDNLG